MKANQRINPIVSNVWEHPCANQSYLGLYFKLHVTTHRPNSLKKTVIKRRKRVPAARGVTTGALTDHVGVTEAHVAVGRLNWVLCLERRRAAERYGSSRRRG